jgi:hypothetical protein
MAQERRDTPAREGHNPEPRLEPQIVIVSMQNAQDGKWLLIRVVLTAMSGLPPIATELRTSLEVRFVPRTEVAVV